MARDLAGGVLKLLLEVDLGKVYGALRTLTPEQRTALAEGCRLFLAEIEKVDQEQDADTNEASVT